MSLACYLLVFSGPEFRVKNTSLELEVAENVGSARVCIEIAHPAIECPVSFRMYMRVSTVHVDTGELNVTLCMREGGGSRRFYVPRFQ